MTLDIMTRATLMPCSLKGVLTMTDIAFMKVHSGSLVASMNGIRFVAYKTANNNTGYRVYQNSLKAMDTLSWNEAQTKYFTLTGNRSLSINY